MKINHTQTTNTSALGKQEAAASGTTGRAAKPTSSGSKSDRLQLSNIGTHLSALRSGSAQGSSSVAELSAAVSGGRYHVDAQQVSRKLIEEHLAA
jgi:flagellar biosynthesis anti-sigma factor FlgM